MANPWEYVPSTEESEALMRANARRIAETRLEAEPDLDPLKVEADSKADALLWDYHMRNLAYQNQIAATDAYAMLGYELRNGEMYHQQTRQAMDRIAALEKEMGELEALRDMAGQHPELGIRFDERELADMGRRLDMERGNMRQAQRAAKADMAEVTGGHSLYSVDKSGNAVAAGESAPQIAKVVEIDPNLLVDKNGVPIDWRDRGAMTKWLLEQYRDMEVTIANDGTIVKFRKKGLQSGLKRRGEQQRKSFAKLDEMIKNAIYDRFENVDARHVGRVKGQRIYYGAARLNGEYLRIKFKLDEQITENELPTYKDHKVTQIEIAPELLTTGRTESASSQSSAISGISLQILRGDVNPTRLENGTLFQQALSTSNILGSTTFRDNTLPVIRLFAGHNASTVRHELAHVIRRNLEASAKRSNARPETIRRYASLEQAFGVKDGKWTVEQEEAFAKSFERYLYEGKAPTHVGMNRHFRLPPCIQHGIPHARGDENPSHSLRHTAATFVFNGR